MSQFRIIERDRISDLLPPALFHWRRIGEVDSGGLELARRPRQHWHLTNADSTQVLEQPASFFVSSMMGRRSQQIIDGRHLRPIPIREQGEQSRPAELEQRDVIATQTDAGCALVLQT